MTKIAILGFGVVGAGTYEVIEKNAEDIKRKCGEPIKVKRVLDVRDFHDHPAQAILTTNFDDILHDDEISIIVESIGGIWPAYEHTKAALAAGKSVVTSNKELVAQHGEKLLELAAQHNARYLYEASVGGGIPIIRPLEHCLAANKITEIFGILNGTTNYILTKMLHEGESFDDALAAAQAKGYAESNPTADVEGYDTCRKIAILAALAFGKHVPSAEIPTEGITKVTLADMQKAEEKGCVIKLIGHAKLEENGEITCKVAPMPIPKESPLSSVNDVFNAIMVTGDSVGDVMFYGRGAGALPTASAIVGDIIDIIRRKK